MIQSAQYTALGEMAAGIAHEINSPLAIISAKSQMIRRMFDREKGHPEKETLEKTYQNLGIVIDTVQRIKNIIDSLRKFSRTSENDEMQICSLNEIIKESLSICGEKMKVAGIEVDLQIPDGSGLNIKCRPVQIGQVFINLLNNSYDALNGLLQPDKKISIQISQNEKDVVIKIHDNGPGIPSEIAKKIMHPFFTTKPVGKGTGLGLSISKGIIEDHQGSLNLDQGVIGACFIIKIPSP
jgi:C4-dicarboxylate-specific signal transduction histidine kinase